jgi:hypothetical protein
VLDKFIRKQGSSEGGAFFLGAKFSYAEVNTLPFLRRGVVILRALRGFDILAIVQAKGLTRLGAWIEVGLAAPCSTAMDLAWKQTPHRAGLAAINRSESAEESWL